MSLKVTRLIMITAVLAAMLFLMAGTGSTSSAGKGTMENGAKAGITSAINYENIKPVTIVPESALRFADDE